MGIATLKSLMRMANMEKKYREVRIDDQRIVEEILQRRRSGVPSGPAIPSHLVKKFLVLIGEEIKQNGEARQEVVDLLLKQLKDGTI